MTMSRRSVVKLLASSIPAAYLPRAFGQEAATGPARQESHTYPARKLAEGPFAANWESLKAYKTPEWFRDAKFGIWAHWSAQCVPEQGDWYARQMYIQGHPQNKYHVKTYGHPSTFGFMELDNLWRAEKWDPEALMDLYVKAGAKYFVALANHHDNFDAYDSKYHEWNSMKVGAKKDIVGTWAEVARKRGLRFGVTNHSGHAWHWLQTAYGYDPEGAMAGVRYDAYKLTKADGKGKWWEGLDPQNLYCGPTYVLPDGIKTAAEALKWHDGHDRRWDENPPAGNQDFVDRWFLRVQDLVDKYKPDLLYFDNMDLPLGQAGLDIAAHFYNASIKNHGKLEAVLNSKGLKPERVGAMVLDIERGRSDKILPEPWQTDTCIGDWHYKKGIRYKSANTVINTLIDIVSKNGNLLLNIPVRGDGTIDDAEKKFLEDLAAWMPDHGEAIYGTRPFSVFGEGPPDVKGGGNFNENTRPYTAEDIRFTTKGETLYAFVLAWPTNGKVSIKTLAAGAEKYPKNIGKIELLGAKDPSLAFTRNADGLTVTMPETKPHDHAYTLKITPT